MVYDIWMEGFHIQGGGPVQASFLGQSEGKDFKEAVLKWYDEHPIQKHSFNPDTLSDWGCRLYPTEAEARKFMG